MTYQEEESARIKRSLSKQAITLAMQGKWQEAVEANKEILASFPKDVDAYNRLGRAYMEIGNYNEAREAYRQAMAIDPYNTIAEKNIRRLSRLGKGAVGVAARKFEPQNFIEEIGKAGVVNLHGLAPPDILAAVVAGDMVQLRIEGANLVVETTSGQYLGRVDPKHAHRLIKLMEGGNRYTVHIISSGENWVTVIIREVYQHPSRAGQLSFPTRVVEDRAYGDRMIRRDTDFEDEFAEESEYPETGEEEGSIEGFHDVDENIEG
jgi:hypothetical protein